MKCLLLVEGFIKVMNGLVMTLKNGLVLTLKEDKRILSVWLLIHSNSTIELHLPVDSQYSSPVEALNLIVKSKSIKSFFVEIFFFFLEIFFFLIAFSSSFR